MVFTWKHFLKVPTRTTSDRSNLPASTEFVRNAIEAYAGSGGGLPARQTAQVTTTSLAVGATWTGTITLSSKTAKIEIVGTDVPAWIRLYNTAAARTADASRPFSVRPRAGNDLVCDNVTTASKLSISQSQTSDFHNEDTERTGTCYVSIKNMGAVAAEITLTLAYLPQES